MQFLVFFLTFLLLKIKQKIKLDQITVAGEKIIHFK